LRAFDSSFSVFTYTARRVVVATPPHISASFQYSPPLPPNKQKLLQHLTQGQMIKTVVLYPVAFWRNNGFSGEVVSSSGVAKPFQNLNHKSLMIVRPSLYLLRRLYTPRLHYRPCSRLLRCWTIGCRCQQAHSAAAAATRFVQIGFIFWPRSSESTAVRLYCLISHVCCPDE
jgi:hypothetical protein